MHDQGPKDGDFARYVESLSQRNPLPAARSAAREPSQVSAEQPYQAGPPASPIAANPKTESPVSPESKIAIAGIVRAILMAFISLFILAPLLPEPFDALIRVAAIFYVVYIIRRNRPAIAQLRNKLTELSK